MSTDISVETIVHAAWCSVLGIKEASPGDNFFASGGHSFAAVQLMTKVETALSIAFPLELLFEGSLETVVRDCELRLAAPSA